MEARVCLHGGGGGPPTPVSAQPLPPLEKGPAARGYARGHAHGPVGGRLGGGAREGVHTCDSEDTPRTYRRQLIMIIYSYQTLRAKCCISFILYSSSGKLMLSNSSP